MEITSINKTIREIRKENGDEGKILRDLDFKFTPEKGHYEPIKNASAFNDGYWMFGRKHRKEYDLFSIN